MNNIPWQVICTGLFCITILASYALHLGYDGMLLTSVIGFIFLTIGITINPQEIISKLKGGK